MAKARTSAKTKTEKPKDPTLEKVLGDFKSAWDYVSGSWHSRWQDNHHLYNNQRVKRGYDGITDTFVPMSFGTVETLTSALFGTKPKFQYVPPSDKQDQETDILNAVLDYFWERDQWSLKIIHTGRSSFKLGVGIDYLYWSGDHPCMINVPLRDFFIDPMCTSIENARFMGRRFLTTKEELESFEIVDPNTGNMVKKYKNLGKLDTGKTNEPTDQQEKNMWYGSTVTEPEKSQIEVIEYWTNDKVISIANRSEVIEDTENYYLAKAKANKVEYPKGIMPFMACRDYTDESLFYAKGEIDFISDQQELLNDITNQNIDAVTYTLNQMYTLDPKYAHLLSEIENLPGAVYPVEAGALTPIPQRAIPPDAFNERVNIKNEIRETTGSSEVVRGVKSDQEATATEVNAQIAGAGQRINLKVTQLENEYFHRLARIVHEMIKLYITEPMMVRILGKDGATWEEFDPKEFQGDYEPKVQLDISVQNKKFELATQAKEMLGAFLNDPDVNQQELKKLVLQRGFDLDPDEVSMLIQDPLEMEQMQEELPPEMPMEMPIDPMAIPPEMMMPIEEPMMDVIVDPVTGELVPLNPEEMMP